jgi:C1A family cysteine protease
MTTRRQLLRSLTATSVAWGFAGPAFALVQREFQAPPGNHFNGYYFGWLRDPPAFKSEVFTAPLGFDQTAPPLVDLRPAMPPVYNQGALGSCTSNAVAAAVQFLRKKDNQPPDFMPSRLFIYYNGRVTEKSVATDSGLSISDGIRAIEQFGVCPETEWPYDSAPANDKGEFPSGSRAVAKPRQEQFKSAYTHRAIDAHSIASMGAARLSDLKACLADGFPFVFGFRIYQSFFDASGQPLAKVGIPPTVDLPVGAHAVLAVGYDDASRVFICRNSWGMKDPKGNPVQDKGYFYMPYDYLLNDDLSADFWTLRSVNALI